MNDIVSIVKMQVQIPVRRHNWRWTSKRERDIPVFDAASGDRVQWHPRQRNWRRTCVRAVTQPPTSANLITIVSLANAQILAQSVNRFLRYRGGCARARVQRYPVMLALALRLWPPTHIPNFNTIGQAVPEIQKCGVHVRTCKDIPSVITACTKTNGAPTAYQISAMGGGLSKREGVLFHWWPFSSKRNDELQLFYTDKSLTWTSKPP